MHDAVRVTLVSLAVGLNLCCNPGDTLRQGDPRGADEKLPQLVRPDGTYPTRPLEVVAPVFSQYVDEIPLNHMDLPPDELPQTRAGMKELLDRVSRWLN